VRNSAFFYHIFHFFSPAAGKIEMTLCPLKDGGQPKQTPRDNVVVVVVVVVSSSRRSSSSSSIGEDGWIRLLAEQQNVFSSFSLSLSSLSLSLYVYDTCEVYTTDVSSEK
jgi:hypothetical protein